VRGKLSGTVIALLMMVHLLPSALRRTDVFFHVISKIPSTLLTKTHPEELVQKVMNRTIITCLGPGGEGKNVAVAVEGRRPGEKIVDASDSFGDFGCLRRAGDSFKTFLPACRASSNKHCVGDFGLWSKYLIDVVHRFGPPCVGDGEDIIGKAGGMAPVMIVAGVGDARRRGGQVLLDCGASDCMTGDRSLIVGQMTPLRIPVRCADKESVLSTSGVGPGCIQVGDGEIRVPKMYFVPGMDMTLVSVSAMQTAGYGINFPPDKAHACISKSGLAVQVQQVGGLYPLAGESSVVSALAARVRNTVNNTYVGGLGASELLHQRLGHVSWSNKFLSAEIATAFGADVAKATKALCTACLEAKLKQTYSRLPPRRPATRPLERVHFDISPKIPVPGARGEVGFMLLVDEFTSRYFIYYIDKKSDVPAILREFKAMAETHFRETMGTMSFPHRLAALRSDGALENDSVVVQRWAALAGIKHELSAPYCQWQNGIVERAMQTVWQGAQALRLAAGAPSELWPFALSAFVYVRNLLPIHGMVSPEEKWAGFVQPFKDRLSHVRTWGCLVHYLVPKALRNKLDPKTRPALNLGYSSRMRAYMCMDLATRVLKFSPNVVFDETFYPCRHPALYGLEAGTLAIDLTGTVLGEEECGGFAPRVDDNLLTPAPAVDVHQTLGRGQHVTVFPEHVRGRVKLATGARLRDEACSLVSDRAPAPQAPVEHLGEIVAGPPPLEEPVPVAQRDELVRDADPFEEEGVLNENDDLVYRVHKVVGHRMARMVRDDGTPVQDFVADQYKLHYEGYLQRDAQWVFRRDIDSPDLLREFEVQQRTQIDKRRAKFPLAVLDFDYTGPGPVVEMDEEVLEAVPQAPEVGSSDVPVADCLNPGEPVVDVIAALMTQMRSLPTDSWRTDDLDVLTQVEPCIPLFDVELRAYKTRLGKQLRGAVGQRIAAARYGKLKRAVTRFRLTCAVAAKMVIADDPLGYKEVMASINASAWRKAMGEELAVMCKFDVYDLVPRPYGVNVVSCRWVFAKKLDVHGRIERLKARLCARGFSQVAGEDFTDTFAPTGRLRVLRAMLAEASGRKDVFTRQWDVTSAFLHSPTDTDIYMEAPPGSLPRGDDRVWKLKRGIYGLRQAGHLFHHLVDEVLTGAGAVRSDADECFYILRRGDAWVKILCYVDDFAVTSNSESLYDEIWQKVQAVLDIKDLGKLRLFLGIHVTYDFDGSISIDQQHYIKQVLTRLGMTATPGVGPKSPMAAGTKAKLGPGGADLCDEDVPYKTAVGALFWIARGSRFDIAYAVSQAARFMEAPTARHWHMVVRIFKYLARTIHRKIRMGPAGSVNDLKLVAYTDSDWAGDAETRKSRTGWLLSVGGACVAWRSSLQTGYSQSATEAEYVAMADAAKEVLWWHKLFRDMRWYCAQPTPIMVDNRGAMLLTTGAGNFNRSKHIALRYHSLRQWTADVLIRAVPIAGVGNYADVMTKNTAVGLFDKLVGQVFEACL
jgi:hypothetical protein